MDKHELKQTLLKKKATVKKIHSKTCFLVNQVER